MLENIFPHGLKKSLPNKLESPKLADCKLLCNYALGDFTLESESSIGDFLGTVLNNKKSNEKITDKTTIIDVTGAPLGIPNKQQVNIGSLQENITPKLLFEGHIEICENQVVHELDGSTVRSYVVQVSNNRGVIKKVDIREKEYSQKAFAIIQSECPEIVFNSAVKNSYAIMRDHMSRLLSEKIQYLPEKHLYKASGWTKLSGTWRYMHGGMPNVHAGRKLEEVRNINEAFGRFFTLSKNLLKPGQEEENYLIFLHSHIGYLSRILEEARFPVHYILFLKGKTNTGKTSLLSELSGEIMYEKPPMARLEDTKSYLEGVIAEMQDSLLLVDDAHPSPTLQGEREIKANIETIVRAYGDSQTRGKRGADRQKLEKTKISGAVWMTGEYLHLAAQSSVLRVLEITLNDNAVNRDTLTILQQNKDIARQYYSGYIYFIEANFEKLVRYFFDTQYSMRKKWADLLKTDIARTVDIAVCLEFISYSIVEYAKYSQQNISNWCTQVEQAIQLYLINKVMIDKKADPIFVFKRMVRELYDAGELRLAPNKDVFRNNMEYIGYIESSIMYIINAKLAKNIKNKCLENGIAYLPPKVPTLYAEGLLASDKVKRFSLYRVDNSRPTMVEIFMDKIINDE
ncbi:hypothetical protein [Pectinatus brassicae]|uniref:DUF927 domain-containing protein n=1 Tax=Pectinatus brassicae TaxID=862415 RepID=A0A840UPK1_9FIRM|nr:hypothetical protein [Pectinatus brassicae]MBB5336132.1 hypothetical protein [Pectinatus brassicae]